MKTTVLAVNAGSSSIKFGLFEDAGHDAPVLLAKGTLEDGKPQSRLEVCDASGSVMDDLRFPEGSSCEGIFGALFEWIDDRFDGRTVTAIGHRIVHGGREFDKPILIDPAVLTAIDRLTPLAPLHQPRSLQPVRAIQSFRPDSAHVACFDTAFHHALKPPVSRYAIPVQYEAEGVRKHGFHGLSYEFVAGRLEEISPELAAGRTVVAHLGSGASLCAMRNGKGVDTTMGFSVLDGLMMGTRCGSLDPGIVLYLQKMHGLSAEQVEEILYHQSGLIGVSGISSDMRALLMSEDPRAREAIELFAFGAARATTAMANTLAGLDCLVFTGGIGEHAPRIRAEICKRLQWLGVEIDPVQNNGGGERINDPRSGVKILVIPTDEESVIARHTLGVLDGAWRLLGK